MVRLHTSLLAVTLATGSVLASSNEYQRRSELDNQVQSREVEQGAVPRRTFRFGLACAGRTNLQSRGFADREDKFVRALDVSDDLEARGRLGLGSVTTAFKYGQRIAEHKHTQNALTAADTISQVYNAVHSRGLESDDLEARGPPGLGSVATAFKYGQRIAEHKHTQNALTAVDLGSQVYNAVHSRGLESDDLEARGPPGLGAVESAFKVGEKLAKHKHTKHILNAIDYEQQVEGALQSRDDNEDLFGRDLDVEELFGREYDLLD